MKQRLVEAAARLRESVLPELRARLAATPVRALQHMGIRVHALDALATSEACACDGAYFPEPYAPVPTIGYVSTPGSRREKFTLLHELGHHLLRLDHSLLSRIGDEDDPDAFEERTCDAFAGSILVPDDVTRALLANRRPEAADLMRLYDTSNGSREACAVRLAEHLRCEGYVALLDTPTRTLRFASPSPEAPYRWRRGSNIPSGHAAWKAVSTGAYRGEGEIVWQSGYRQQLWLDAVRVGSLVVAIFSADRYWQASDLGILSDPAITRSAPVAFSGTCPHCGSNVYGLRACDQCGNVKCRKCGKCGCGAPPPAQRVCTSCHMVKGKAQFRAGSAVCKDCDAR